MDIGKRVLGVVHPAPCRRPNRRFLPGVMAGICRAVNDRSEVSAMRRMYLPDLPRMKLGDRCKIWPQRGQLRSVGYCRSGRGPRCGRLGG